MERTPVCEQESCVTVVPRPASFGKFNDLNLSLTDAQKARET